MRNRPANTKRYLVASDFDQTLSFNDSGRVLSEIMGISGLDEKMNGLAKANLVQQGAELAYLLEARPGIPESPQRTPDRGRKAGSPEK